MKNSDTVTMFLNIGDQQLTVTVPAARQEFVRNVESGITDLYNKWRRQFPGKPDREILAMVAYQYASFYATLSERYEEATRLAADCLEEVQRDTTATATDSGQNAEPMQL